VPYAPLGYRPVNAVKDVTGNNTGNYSAVFTPDVIGANVPYFELYHFYVTAPMSTGGNQPTVQVGLNQGLWDYNLVASGNGWDPAQPMLMTPGDTLAFYFNIAATVTTVPSVTAWFRYDTAFVQGVLM
jgi:hypothetical protein